MTDQKTLDMLHGVAELRERLDQVLGAYDPPAGSEHPLPSLGDPSNWPKAEGIVAAKCERHGDVEPINVGSTALWCPECYREPVLVFDGEKYLANPLRIQLEAPINFIEITCRVAAAEDE